MKNETQNKLQMTSWITKDRWDPLLNWFNQNDTRPEDWTLLFEQASRHELQKKWTRYLDFFQKHLDQKTMRGASFLTSSDVRNKAWKLLNAAMPGFFIQAAPLLTQQQREVLRSRAMVWFSAWTPSSQESQTLNIRDTLSTVFRTLISVDGRAEWEKFEGLVKKEYFPRLVQHTLGKDVHWANALEVLYLSHGHSQSSWRTILFKADCVEQLLADKTPLVLAHALLDCAVEEQGHRGGKAEDAIAMIFRRYPHFRVWSEKGKGDDAQTCRAILGFHEATPPCVAAQAMQMAHSLGLPLSAFSALLEPMTAPVEMQVNASVFEDMPIAK